MHEISPKTAQEEIEHAKISLRHGKTIEEIGNRLQDSDKTDREYSQRIVEYGKNVQKQAQKSLEKAQELAKDGSIELFTEALQAHIDTTESYIESVTEFQKRLQHHLSQQKNDSE